MSTRLPRVSIGVPVYNGEEFLAEAIDALLAQTYTNFELIVSDNASTDATADICREYAKRDHRVRYHRQPQNRGACWNFCHVFTLAQGEFFRWATHDDTCAPTLLERCVAALDEDPTVLWVQSRRRQIDPQRRVLPGQEEIASPPQHCRGQSPAQRFTDVLLGGSCAVDVLALMRTNALRKTRLMLPVYGAEKVLIGELSLLGRYFEIPEVLFDQRVHPKSSGSLRTVREQQQFIDPSQISCWMSPRLRLFLGHLRSVWRHPLGLFQRLGCLVGLARYVLQIGKWGRVLSSVLHRSGTGGGFRRQLQRLESPATEKR